MPKRKVYMIVTNDEYETPVVCDIVGRKAVCDYLGITEKMLWLAMKNDKWVGEYRAIDMGYDTEYEDLQPTEIEISEEERIARINKYKQKKHTASLNNTREYARKYYESNRQKMIEKGKRYYREHREERIEYSSMQWKRRKHENVSRSQ